METQFLRLTRLDKCCNLGTRPPSKRPLVPKKSAESFNNRDSMLDCSPLAVFDFIGLEKKSSPAKKREKEESGTCQCLHKNQENALETDGQ